MLITERRAGDEVVLALSGRLIEDDEYRPGGLAGLVDRLTAAGPVRIIVDLANLEQIDALGLGEIVAAFRHAQARGADLRLQRPRARLDRLLSVTRLRSVIAVTAEDDEARDSGAGCRPPTERGNMPPWRAA